MSGQGDGEVRQIVHVGLSHLSAPLACREKIGVLTGELSAALDSVRAVAELSEAVVLSTCSRVEVYGVAHDAERAEGALRSWFLERGGPAIEPALYSGIGRKSVLHVFRVASGLDSWIIGESEILAQLKRAYEAARSAGQTGPVLNRLFQSAAACGKKVRTDTGISNGIHSIGGACALLAKKLFAEAGGTVVVFGAGEAAEAVVRHLAAKNFTDVVVASRTLERAQALAGKQGARAVSFAEGLELLKEAKVAVFSASCPEPLLDRSKLRALVAGRVQPLFVIDLAVPRNVAPDCGSLDGVFLYDIEALKGVVADSMTQKASAKELAESLIVEQVEDCLLQYRKAAQRRLEALAA